MIAKKNSRVDLERKRTALFAIGLLMVGSFVLAAFTYETPNEVKMAKEEVPSQKINYIIQKQDDVQKDQTVKDQSSQSDQQQQQSEPTMDAFSNPTEDINQTSNQDKAFDPTVGIDHLGYKYGEDMPFVEDLEEEVFEWVDTDAEFVGGYTEMMNFINSTVEYPADAIDDGMQGRVYLNFIVEKDGSITNISVEKGVCRSLDREAKRIVREFPNWIPAEFEARKVRTRVRLPIVFVLD